jgi:hypothetical protein
MNDTTWWGRNWKWFVPAGCLTIVLLGVGFVATLVFFVFGMMKNTDAYTDAVRAARDNPAVVAALGTPIEEGFMVSGSFNESGPSGTADLAIPLRGPHGAATVYVEAKKSAGEWTYTKMVAEIEATHARIDLLEPAAVEKVEPDNPP